MAAYAYKSVRDIMPGRVMTTQYYRDTSCGTCNGMCKHPCTYDGDANYDGDMWYVTASYIDELQTALREAAKMPNASPDITRLVSELPSLAAAPDPLGGGE